MPSWPTSSVIVVCSFAVSLALLWFCGKLKQKYRLRTGLSRKTFHFLIFSLSAIIQFKLGLPFLCLFGAGVSVTVFISLFKGAGNILFEAIARESDHPYRALLIVVPYLATLVGGLTSNMLFGPFAIIGYMVCGVGDASGEVIGVRFGKHPYRIKFGRIFLSSAKTLEGSAAVLLFSWSGCVLAGLLAGVVNIPELLLNSVLVALLSVVVEAVSPRGTDNFTMQLIPSYVFSILA